MFPGGSDEVVRARRRPGGCGLSRHETVAVCSDGMSANPVKAVLVSHGTRALWHYTLVEHLTGILSEGAVYSRAELQRRGLPFNSAHYYGDAEKERVLPEYVSCATMPPWGMMGKETNEISILDVNPSVVATPGTCFCPGWSPLATFDAEEITTWTGPEHAEALYSGPGYQTVRGAEIFVPTAIALQYVRAIVFYDMDGAERALPELRAALAASQAGPSRDHTITVKADATRFPKNWEATGPPWMRGEDVDDEPIF
jgi:ssDNA thymidine ADP-ribosyltransferase, DarT